MKCPFCKVPCGNSHCAYSNSLTKTNTCDIVESGANMNLVYLDDFIYMLECTGLRLLSEEEVTTITRTTNENIYS